LPLVTTVATVWIPVAAEVTPANSVDNVAAPVLLTELPPELRFLLGDQTYHDLTEQFRGIFHGHGHAPTR
jgi:hypothetical protein